MIESEGPRLRQVPCRYNESRGAFMAQNGFKDLLKNTGFHSFLWTQFLGAFNDNVYKILVSMRAVHVAANTGSGSQYLSLAGVVFAATRSEEHTAELQSRQ